MVRTNPNGKPPDIGWSYGVLLDEQTPSVGIKCSFCGKVTKGGITRHKHHLAGNHKDVAKCNKVSVEAKEEILTHFLEKKEAKELMERIPHMDDFDTMMEEEEDEFVDEDSSRANKKRSISSGTSNASNTSEAKRTRPTGPMDKFFKQSTVSGTKTGNLVGSKEYHERQKELRHTAIQQFCRWMYEAGIPFNTVRYDTLGKAFQAIGEHGPGCKPPSYHEVRIKMLNEEIVHTNELLKLNEVEKATYGCSLMADGWRDNKGRALVNFLVNTPKGSMFIESVDASSYLHTGHAMFELFDTVIQKVGPNDIIQVITDCASHNVIAGRLIEKKYPHITWAPCAAYFIDLMLEDMFKMPELNKTIERAVQVSTYIYNRTLLLNMMRAFTNQKELVRPTKTRFATAFVTLNRMREQKNNLKKMFTSEEWNTSKFAKEVVGKRIQNLILNNGFWNSVAFACKVGGPIISVLRLVDGEVKPPMGYVYHAMTKAKEKIAANFNHHQHIYRDVLKIVDGRWKSQWEQPLHLAAYYLNPTLYYDNAAEIEDDATIKKGLYACIKKLAVNEEEDDKITEQLGLYTGAEDLFSNPSAIRQRTKISPAQWWKQYGSSAPNLRKFAIKVLSLTCSLSRCERNLSVFEHLHSKKINRLEQQKLNDLVYIKYNRALRRRYESRHKIDPILLDDMGVADPNEFLLDVLDDDDDDDDDDDGNEEVFPDEGLTWKQVAKTMGVDEPLHSTRSRTTKTKTSSRKGSKSTSTFSKAIRDNAKSKGKAPMRLIDEEEEFEDDEREEESEEENNIDEYKDDQFIEDEENFVDEDDIEELDDD